VKKAGQVAIVELVRAVLILSAAFGACMLFRG